MSTAYTAPGGGRRRARTHLTELEAPGHVIDAVAGVRRIGGAVDARRLARLLKVTPSVAATRLQRAARLGLLRRVARGQYACSN